MIAHIAGAGLEDPPDVGLRSARGDPEQLQDSPLPFAYKESARALASLDREEAPATPKPPGKYECRAFKTGEMEGEITAITAEPSREFSKVNTFATMDLGVYPQSNWMIQNFAGRTLLARLSLHIPELGRLLEGERTDHADSANVGASHSMKNPPSVSALIASRWRSQVSRDRHAAASTEV